MDYLLALDRKDKAGEYLFRVILSVKVSHILQYFRNDNQTLFKFAFGPSSLKKELLTAVFAILGPQKVVLPLDSSFPGRKGEKHPCDSPTEVTGDKHYHLHQHEPLGTLQGVLMALELLTGHEDMCRPQVKTSSLTVPSNHSENVSD